LYAALSYDHRVIDGREAIGFLNRVKELIEEPDKLLMEL
jgi:2-oxoglutarate dehydrogenase E2 component (dihydrolipoamide succinyltransferase)